MNWKRKRNQKKKNDRARTVKRRVLVPERLEARQLLAADPIHVGIVYVETDYLESDQDVGSDSSGDRFILSFTGGAPNTELNEIRIITDKDGNGIAIGDAIFDTQQGGRGIGGAHDFVLAEVHSADGSPIEVTAEVDDGGQELVLRMSGFRAGDRLEFTIDVDEVLRLSEDLEFFNSRLDTIVSGQEFQDSILKATFNAPHYETRNVDTVFLNDFGDPFASKGLDLPPNEGSGIYSRPNRTAAAIATTVQVPKPISISGQVWLDNDLNKVRDANEQPLSDVEVSLWRWNEATNRYVDTAQRTTTDANGEYLFSRALGLQPGRYRIVQTQPEGLFSVAAIPGSVQGAASGRVESMDILSDIDIQLGDTDAIRYDFAEANAASLSGYVYRDDNNDGVRDAAEPGIAGIRIRLIPISTVASQSIVTATTGADGSYSFTGLAPGAYEVIQLDQPDYLNDGLDTAGTVNGVTVGRADNPGDAIRDIVLAGANQGIEYNFGETPFGSISGFVYLVAPGQDCNGIHDAPGNTPLRDVRVELQDEFGVIITTTRTGADGFYLFSEMPIGNYRIVEYTPTGLLDGRSQVGSIDGVRSGVSIDGGLIQQITMTAAGVGVDYNFCEIAPATLSGFVYHDRSNDGVRDPGEEPIAEVTVSLVDVHGSVVQTARTDANGRYEFADVLPGVYSVLQTQPDDYYDGKDAPGTVRGRTVGRVAESDLIIDVELKQGDIAVDFNFGELLGASLAGRVHVDLNDDCYYNPGEPGLAGIDITLFDVDGNEVARTRTNEDGTYQFQNLRPGEYSVVEGPVEGYFDGTARVGSAGGVVNSANRIGEITLSSGEVAIDYNFCEKPPAEISGIVFSDPNGNGIHDSGEVVISNVVVELYDEAGVKIASARTGADGMYRFTYLPKGNYTVREIQPQGWLQGGQVAGSHGGDATVVDTISAIPINWGDRLIQYNFYEIEPGSISGFVYVDSNANCVRDPDEAPLEGVLIELRDSSGRILQQTQTDALGRYSFAGLPPGEYEITQQQPEGYFQGGQTVGTGGGRVIGVDHLGTTLLAGANIDEYNFCELPPGSISGIVFVDSNDNSQRDPGELLLANVRIDLRNAQGQVVASTRTNAEGGYRFEGLAPGEYHIAEHQPEGYFQGGQTVGSAGGRVLADDLLAMELTAGKSETEYNFYELAPSSIEGFVYVDTDHDCVRDEGEPPLADVLIELFDDHGNRIAQTRTDSLGQYRFGNLPPGRYHIKETQPEGYFQGSQQVGSGGGEVVGEDHLMLDLTAGNDVVDYNFCELEPSSIAGSVWRETDLNQRFDPGEVPLAGVQIELLNSQGQVIAQSRTNARGDYEFANLPPGVYAVRQIQPNGLFHGGQVIGSAGGSVGGDDFLVGILLSGGTKAVDYDFPEVPPATISGYVFQDGDAILLAAPPNPEDLREYRDGILKDSDLRISGVRLELRNVLGQPFAADRALPGVYSGETIYVTTDENGYYEFTGLRPGTYHVYQVQPDNFIDGLDTPGTTGGLAVNPADRVDDDGRILIQTLALSEATDPRDDAILNISLQAGASSSGNNFSEIAITDPLAPPLTNPATEVPQVFAPIETFDNHVRLVSFGSIHSMRSPMLADDEWAVSWHLSIINGGFPRGGDDAEATIRSVSASMMAENWNQDTYRKGRWIIVNSDGELMELSDTMMLGEADAIALTGDFDGDGTDEAVLYVNGNWFIDFNGNGRWDEGDLWLKLGTELDRPVVGDWDGDGKEDIAIFGRQWQRDPQRIKTDPGLPSLANKRRRQLSPEEHARHEEDRGDDRKRLLRRGSRGTLRADAVDHVFQYGEQVDVPVAGDWNGDGIDQIGVFRSGDWLLDTDGDGRWTDNDELVRFGQPGDEPVVGDFNGDGIDQIAVVRGDLWIIDTDGDRKLTENDLHLRVPRGGGNSQPIVGDFDGDGKDELGYYEESA